MVEYSPTNEEYLSDLDDYSPAGGASFLEDSLQPEAKPEDTGGSMMDFLLQNGRAPSRAEAERWGGLKPRSEFQGMGDMGGYDPMIEPNYDIFGLPDITGNYPQAPGQPAGPLTPEQALAGMGVAESYSARLQDYLNQRLYEDQPQLAEVNRALDEYALNLLGMVERGEISASEAQRLEDEEERSLKGSLIDIEKAQEIASIAKELIGRGFSAEDTMQGITQRLTEMGYKDVPVPDLSGSLTTIGPQASKLWQDAMARQQATNDPLANLQARVASGELSQRDAALIEQQYSQGLGGSFEEEIPPDIAVPTGREEAEYYTYIENLGAPPQYNNYLMNLYQQLYGEWLKIQRPRKDTFIKFVREYLAKGGL